jgi:hypothetical protein
MFSSRIRENAGEIAANFPAFLRMRVQTLHKRCHVPVPAKLPDSQGGSPNEPGESQVGSMFMRKLGLVQFRADSGYIVGIVK